MVARTYGGREHATKLVPRDAVRAARSPTVILMLFDAMQQRDTKLDAAAL